MKCNKVNCRTYRRRKQKNIKNKHRNKEIQKNRQVDDIISPEREKVIFRKNQDKSKTLKKRRKRDKTTTKNNNTKK